jgi:acyl-CoA synthetase (AMP-forming)/AMP-acid ligase II
MILRGAENIYPSEIEAVLAHLPGVREVAVIGVPDQHWGQSVHAHLVVDDPETFNPTDARNHCRDHLAAYKVPDQFHLTNHLPKNASGKILKQQLTDR